MSSPPLCVVTIESAFVPSTAFDFYFKYTHPDNPAPPRRQGTGLLELRYWLCHIRQSFHTQVAARKL